MYYSDNSLFLLEGLGGQGVCAVGGFYVFEAGVDLLDLLDDGDGVGPEAEVGVPFLEGEGAVGGAVAFLDLPVLEGQQELGLVLGEDGGVEVVVLALEVVAVLLDALGLHHPEVGVLVLGAGVVDVARDDLLEGVVLLEALGLRQGHPLIPPLVVLVAVQGPSVLELEHFLLEVGGLVVLGVGGVVLLEVVFGEVVAVVGEEFLAVEVLG